MDLEMLTVVATVASTGLVILLAVAGGMLREFMALRDRVSFLEGRMAGTPRIDKSNDDTTKPAPEPES